MSFVVVNIRAGPSLCAHGLMDSLSFLLRVLSSYSSCFAGAPLLTKSRTTSISLLLLFRVREEAVLDSTRGVVTRTSEMG